MKLKEHFDLYKKSNQVEQKQTQETKKEVIKIMQCPTWWKCGENCTNKCIA